MNPNRNLNLPVDYNRTFDNRAGEEFKGIQETIYPVVQIEPILDVIIESSVTSSGVTTIYTVPTTKDFYLVGWISSFVKNAACDAASGTIGLRVATNGGTTLRVMGMSSLTLTAERDSQVVMLPKAIRCTAGQVIGHSNTSFTAGNLIRHVTIYGYTREKVTQ